MSMWHHYSALPGSTNNKAVVIATGVGLGLILAGIGFLVYDAIKDAKLEDQIQHVPTQINLLAPKLTHLYQALPSKEMIYVKGTQATYHISSLLRI